MKNIFKKVKIWYTKALIKLVLYSVDQHMETFWLKDNEVEKVLNKWIKDNNAVITDINHIEITEPEEKQKWFCIVLSYVV